MNESPNTDTQAEDAAMVAWLSDCEWLEIEAEEIADLSSATIRRAVERHYEGGIAQFLIDGEHPAPTPTISALAAVAGQFMTTKRVNRAGGPEGGEMITALTDEHPGWIHDLVREAHGGNFLPDDWRYAAIRAALSFIDDVGYDDADDGEFEFADGNVDTYTADLIRWFGSSVTRPGYVDSALEEFDPGTNDAMGQPAGVIEFIRAGQYAESREVFAAVVRALEERLESLCTQCGASTDDGEGWDGLCGSCADVAETTIEDGEVWVSGERRGTYREHDGKISAVLGGRAFYVEPKAKRVDVLEGSAVAFRLPCEITDPAAAALNALRELVDRIVADTL